MDAGARGVEIKISGKVTSQRARTQFFRAGTISKSGSSAQEGVDKGVAQCIQKTGVMGVVVKIMLPDVKMGDDVKIKGDLLKQEQARMEAKLATTKVKEAVKKEYEVTEEEGELSDEEKQLLDEVDETDVSEISLEPSNGEQKKNE